MEDGDFITLLQDNIIEVNVDVSEIITLNGVAQVIESDITAENGVIHIIDEVLLPAEALEQLGAERGDE